MLISVIGGNEPSQIAVERATQVGRELALRGAIVVCGGLGGVMEAVCRGAKTEGGTTIGKLPGNDPHSANPWVDIPICTTMGYARNIIVVNSGRAVIAIDGSYGTLSEISYALSGGVPVIGLDTWSFYQNDQLDHGIIQASDPIDAVNKALSFAESRTQPHGPE